MPHIVLFLVFLQYLINYVECVSSHLSMYIDVDTSVHYIDNSFSLELFLSKVLDLGFNEPWH